ncbi:hypothetical protein [Hydrogenophaga sp. 2FB]|uniref:hypothetical protein n=1 Tax=Hydrogenophaga sp. 2FB TaxID=2502187 RepID=UPI0010F74F91|nr:hypothetical protein [Hydrogenophaga sp. 2FB]
MSLEGNGLSVSEVPDAWREIARLGDAPTWLLRPPGSAAQFLAVNALEAAHRDVVTSWAELRGYLCDSRLAAVSWNDADDGARREMTFDLGAEDGLGHSIQDAEAELEEVLDQDGRIELRQGCAATALLNQRIGYKVPPALAFDMALTTFVEDLLFPELGFQGAWWLDALDIPKLSAPRGVLHLSALPFWSREKQEEIKRPRPRR